MNTILSRPNLGRKIVLTAWLGVALPFFTLTILVPFLHAYDLISVIPAPILVFISVLLAPFLAFLVPSIYNLFPESIDDWIRKTNQFWLILWCVGVLFSWFYLGRIVTYLTDSQYTNASLLPDDLFLTRHSCLTAYLHGAILLDDPMANVYDLKYVDLKMEDPLPECAAHFHPFKLDAYGYPPPFLLVPKLLHLFTKNFFSLRALFSGFSMLFVLFTIFKIAKVLGGVFEKRILLFTPILTFSPPLIVGLQIGNVHLIIVCMCILSWIMMENKNTVLSGFLISLGTIFKIFPGLLGIILFVNKKYKIIFATALSAILLIGLSIPILGIKVWKDFIFYQMPNLETGRALGFLADDVKTIDFNIAPFGIPFKLAYLKIVDWGWAEAKIFTTLFSIFLLVVSILAGRIQGSKSHRLSIWISITMFASLRSPYAAPYTLGTMLFLYLVMLGEIDSKKSLFRFLFLFVLKLMFDRQ